MFRVLVVAVYAALSFRYGAWKKWKEYYSTYLYVILGDLAYNFIFYEKALWEYDRLISHTLSDLLIAMVVFPCAITLFLTHYPEKIWKQALYILLWSGTSAAVEHLSNKLGYILYYNNWNIAWSFLLYCIAFILVRIHYIKPLLVWPISLALTYLTMFLFNVPLTGMK